MAKQRGGASCAALTGLDCGDKGEWAALNAARLKLDPTLSHDDAAERYRTTALA